MQNVRAFMKEALRKEQDRTGPSAVSVVRGAVRRRVSRWSAAAELGHVFRTG